MAVIALIGDKRAELEELCVRYHVLRLALFGSATDETFDPERSDLDFAVEFASLSPGEHSESYFGLMEAMEALFQRSVDLVEYRPIRNPYFRRSLEESQVVLYEARCNALSKVRCTWPGRRMRPHAREAAKL